MIPLIEKEVVNKKEWINRKDFVEMLSIDQSALESIAVNITVFVGYKVFVMWLML